MPCEHFTRKTSPQISQTVKTFQTKILNPTKWVCKVCQVSCDIYVCLFCGTFLCGSQVQSHANAHFLETSHSLYIHINSLSCYCFACNKRIPTNKCNKFVKNLLKELKHCQNAHDLSPDSSTPSPSPQSIPSPGLYTNTQNHQLQQQQSPLCCISTSPISRDSTESFSPLQDSNSNSDVINGDDVSDDATDGSLLRSRSRFQYTNEELILEDRIATAKKYYEVKLMKNAFKLWREMAKTSIIRKKLDIEALTSSDDDDVIVNNQIKEEEKEEKIIEKTKKSKKAKLIPGKTGLRNLGNTCFMNSVLQALAGIPKFRKYFMNMLWINQEKKNRIILEKNPQILFDSAHNFDFINHNLKNINDDGHSPKLNSDVIIIKHTDECLNSVKQRHSSRRSCCITNTTTNNSNINSSSSSSNNNSNNNNGITNSNSNNSSKKSNKINNQIKQEDNLNSISICQNLHELLRVLWSGKWAVVSPFAMLESLWRISPGFQGYQQQDAQEFLCTLFGRIQQEVAGGVFQPVCNDSNGIRTIVTDIFQGEIYTEIKCRCCGNVSAKLETFLDLSLSVPVNKPGDVAKTIRRKVETKCIDDNTIINKDIKKENNNNNENKDVDMNTNINNDINNVNINIKKEIPNTEDLSTTTTTTIITDKVDIEQCLHKYMDSENLGDDYICDGCHKKTNPTKSCRLYKLPRILCFVLKRFLWTGKGSCGFSKIIKSVSFPFILDIGKFCCKSSFEGKSMRYSLQSLVCHHGSGLYSGHYTAYTASDGGKLWTHFNDSVVTSVDEMDVLEDGRKSGYIFFYQCIEEEIPDPFDLPEPLRMAAASLKKSMSSSFSSSSLILSTSSTSISSSTSSTSLNNNNSISLPKRYSLRNSINSKFSESSLSSRSKLTKKNNSSDDDVTKIGENDSDSKKKRSTKDKNENENVDKNEDKIQEKTKYSLRSSDSKKRKMTTKKEENTFTDPEPKKKRAKTKSSK